jgi:hypothetical protein
MGEEFEFPYPYVLGYHIASESLCRLHKGKKIPRGFVKVIRHRYGLGTRVLSRMKINPYHSNGELMSEYWGIYRAEDILRRLQNDK